MTTYQEFLASKAQLDGVAGFDPEWLPGFLFPFQRALTGWAIRQGRAALFADCGLGKSAMELVWAENTRRRTGKPTLIVTPLAVSFQMQAEAAKFGIDAAISRDGRATGPITVTNYERLHLFDQADYGAVVADESSAIKAFDGERRHLVTEFLRRMPYRLLGTATAAPNDYIELGTSSEALGYLGYMDMLARFFTNDQKARMWGRGAQWRLKGHAEDPFWRWVASWARRCGVRPTSASPTTGSCCRRWSTAPTSLRSGARQMRVRCSMSPRPGCGKSRPRLAGRSPSAASRPQHCSPGTTPGLPGVT